MRKHMLTVALLAMLAPWVVAGEGTCPASRAADAGFAPFEAFHTIMAPAWHKAWPERNYEALFEAGPEFTSAFKRIAILKPALKTVARRKAFMNNLKTFSNLVREYDAACAARDSELVYDLMPRLHDAFEATAASLLPVYYPEFEALIITLNLIIETHLPHNNAEGIVGSTETLLSKAETLVERPLPEELTESEKDIRTDLEIIRQLVLHMMESMYRDDMERYVIYATELQILVNEFIDKFI